MLKLICKKFAVSSENKIRKTNGIHYKVQFIVNLIIFNEFKSSLEIMIISSHLKHKKKEIFE